MSVSTTRLTDRHYTPEWLADIVAAGLPSNVTSVVDLAAGTGALLEAVHRRFRGRISVSAADIDPFAVNWLRRQWPDWNVSNTDSLVPASFRRSFAYRNSGARHDAAVLNPPFSYRGGARWPIRYEGLEYKVTPATAFVARAMQWIRTDGTIVAIVPVSVSSVVGDRDLWSAWSKRFLIDPVRILDRNTFRGAHTKTMVLSMDLGAPSIDSIALSGRRLRIESLDTWSSNCVCVDVIRGRVPVHRVHRYRTETGVPFVHSTELGEERVRSTTLSADRTLATEGPMVLVPRVGAPRHDKISMLAAGPVVLSDCVMGIRPLDPGLLVDLHSKLVSEFAALANLYRGSCAPYLTVAQLIDLLRSLGLAPEVSAASEGPGWCRCRAAELALG